LLSKENFQIQIKMQESSLQQKLTLKKEKPTKTRIIISVEQDNQNVIDDYSFDFKCKRTILCLN